MIAKELDEEKLRNDLINLYQRFIAEPYNLSLKREMWDLSGKYASAGDLIHNPLVARALNDLAFFAQKELPEGKDHLVEARKILEELRKSE
jgi:hypothetical protein